MVQQLKRWACTTYNTTFLEYRLRIETLRKRLNKDLDHSMNLYLNLKYQYQIYYPLLLNIIAQYLILFMIYVFTIELSPIRIFVFIY